MRATHAPLAGLFLLLFSGGLAAQGIGLPDQSKGAPIEINAEQGIEWQQKTKA